MLEQLLVWMEGGLIASPESIARFAELEHHHQCLLSSFVWMDASGAVRGARHLHRPCWVLEEEHHAVEKRRPPWSMILLVLGWDLVKAHHLTRNQDSET